MYWPPMLPAASAEPFDDERYIFEPKFPGRRLLLEVENGAVRLYSRNGEDVTSRYPELHRVPLEDTSGALLDGQAVCFDPESGRIDAGSGADGRHGLTRPMSIREAAIVRPVHFFVYDVLRYRDKDVRSLRLSGRRQLLLDALEGNRYISPAMSVEGRGIDLYEGLRGRGPEGIVAKRLSSPYVGRRDDNWLSVRYYEYAVVQIAGFRKNQFGWLMRHRGRDVGLLEIGIPSAHKNAFMGVSRRIATGEDRDYVYVDPAIEARVRYRSLSPTGELLHPEFVDFVVS